MRGQAEVQMQMSNSDLTLMNVPGAVSNLYLLVTTPQAAEVSEDPLPQVTSHDENSVTSMVSVDFPDLELKYKTDTAQNYLQLDRTVWGVSPVTWAQGQLCFIGV